MNEKSSNKETGKSSNKDSFLFYDSLFEIAEYEGVSSMCTNEHALLIIVSELKRYPEQPYDAWCPERIKEEISFSQWALNEMLDIVWDHPWNTASNLIEEFALKCQVYEAISVLPKQKRIFSIAAKTAQKILGEIKEVEKT